MSEKATLVRYVVVKYLEKMIKRNLRSEKPTRGRVKLEIIFKRLQKSFLRTKLKVLAIKTLK